MRISHFLSASAIAFAAFLVVPGSLHATSAAPANIADLVEKSERAFVATVNSSETVKLPDGKWADRVTVTVTDEVYGAPKGQTVTWNQYRIGQLSRVPGMPVFRPGEEHLIFLSGKVPGSTFQAPIALGQGDFRITLDATTKTRTAANEANNTYLYYKLDAGKIAEVLVAQETVTRTEEEKKIAIEDRKNALLGQRFGATSVDVLKETAQALRKIDKPAQKFAREVAPGESLDEMPVLQSTRP